MSDEKKKWQFDWSDCEAILPPDSLSWIRTWVDIGPSMQVLEHCHYASTMKEMWRRAPIFHMACRLSKKGERLEWPGTGMHAQVEIPIAIVGSTRLNDHEFHINGHVKLVEDFSLAVLDCDSDNDTSVGLKSYSTKNRRGELTMSRGLYIDIIDLWQRNFLNPSSGYREE